MSNIIEYCYQCPYLEDRRAYWCKKLNEFVCPQPIPEKCPLPKGEVTKTVTIKGRKIN